MALFGGFMLEKVISIRKKCYVVSENSISVPGSEKLPTPMEISLELRTNFDHLSVSVHWKNLTTNSIVKIIFKFQKCFFFLG